MSHQESALRQKVFAFSKTQTARPLNLCMCPWEKCERKAIRAHSVQNSRVLELLQRRGHVVMPRLHTSFEGGPDLEFSEVGRNKATTFTGLCAVHDARLFAPIEHQAFEPKNPEHLFLIAYRAVLKEAHSSLKAGIDVQSTFLHGVETGLFPRNEPSTPGMFAVEQMMAAYLVHEIREKFDAAYLARSWGSVSHVLVQLDVPPSVAVNALFTTDLWSEQTDSPASVCLNVIPYHSSTVAVFSSLLEHAPHVRTAFDRVLSSSGHYQRYELSKLILKKCENLVVSPAHFDRLPRRQKAMITEFFTRNMGDMEHELDHPALDIFTPYRAEQ